MVDFGVFSAEDCFCRLRRAVELDVRTELLPGGVELGMESDISSSIQGGDTKVGDGMGKPRYLARDKLCA